MSAALYGRDSSGVTRQIKKLYASAGGVNRELKELWARDSGGINRKIFSGAIMWTYETGVSDSVLAHLSADPASSFSLIVSWTPTATSGDRASGHVVYTFSEPFLMQAGQTIEGEFEAPPHWVANHFVYLNGSSTEIFDIDSAGITGTVSKTYTFSQDTMINQIKCSISVPTYKYGSSV